MGIKREAYEIHFSARSDERELAERLDDAFDVTRGEPWKDLSFWSADPKKHTRERFGLQQEVLVIYSKHPETDARVFRAIDEITAKREYRLRFDPVLFLLIHNGDPEQTRELLRRDHNRVIVPITATELRDTTKGPIFVRLRIAQFFGEIDLFGMSSPIELDRYFFGRDNLVQELVVRSVSQGENSGIFGLRKTGKTSVLRAFERRIVDRPILTEYVDCHGPGIHAARWWQVLENLVERLQQTLRRTKKRTAKVKLKYTQTNAGSRFSSDIQTILQDGQLERVVLMLDEVEFITPQISGQLGRHWDEDFVPFWQTIRATYQETHGRLLFILAGVNPLSVQRSRFAELPNPIFQLALPHFLEPFDRSSVRAMVRTIGKYSGLRFDEDVYGYLTSRYGGHPFLIRIACSEVWRAVEISDPHRRTQVAVEDFKSRENEIRARLADPIRDILLSLVWWYPEEYDLLQILAEGGDEFVTEYIDEHRESLVQFAKYGLLEENGSGEFAISDLRQFLREHGDDYRAELSPFRRSDVPPELLPAVPDLKTLGKLFQKRCEVEAKLRRLIIFYLGVQENWDPEGISRAILKGLHRRPDRPSPESLFVGRKPQDVVNQLYLLDLKFIILENWSVFKALFDNQKSRLKMNMDTVNTARRVETHTKPFTPEEIEDFENSYAWILRKLSKVPGLEDISA